MVRKISSIQKPITVGIYCKQMYPHLLMSFFLAAAILSNPGTANAESLASKNRKGNRFFAEGRYEAAEKAYLDAQVGSPGKPEILYNLGNSLIKQGKYSQGIRALRQSADKGDAKIKTASLYNAGNALYSMGNYRESVESYVEALKLNPDDTDAKHNLELALRKLTRQKQNQKASGGDPETPPDRESRQPGENKEERVQAGGQSRQYPDRRDSGKEHGERQTDRQDPREGSITKEQAQRILDAVQNQELEQQRSLMESRSRPRSDRRDW